MTELISQQIADLVTKAIKKAQKKGHLPAFDIPEIVVERPKQETHGDYSTAVCMGLAKYARMAPVKIAEIVVAHLPKADFVGKVEVAHPGYLNFTLDTGWVCRQVDAILQAGENFGRLDIGRGKRVQVEYGSANPTGPLHMGTGRNVVIGDTLANVLEAAGYSVHREYYVNDAGSRMRAFYETLYARYAQALGRDVPVPEDGYHGRYMVDMAAEIVAREGARFLEMPKEQALPQLGKLGLELILKQAKEDLARMSIHYDNWFSEQSLYDDGTFGRVMTILREGGYVVEKEGAIWFTSPNLPDDEVLIRSDGTPLYFASDISYHYNKFILRGFDWVIDVWGADHQGHVPGMKAMMPALGLHPDQLTIILYQLVTLRRGGEIVRISKRTGDIITLREVLDEVGPDAVRFFLLARTADSQMDFDLELAKEQSQENPVYYVQYGHARIASILRYAEEQGMADYVGGDVSLLTTPPEQALIRKMLELPEVLEQATTKLAPHLLPHYAQSLAATFHSFYKECRVISSLPEDRELSRARLKLVLAAKVVLARVLRLMGVAAPERM
ncbi:MAG: arginine--tRNA ligase [Anaerolineae bacterium]|nr:arginine--tRNA ligase [Anaerolineae bacterium]